MKNVLLAAAPLLLAAPALCQCDPVKVLASDGGQDHRFGSAVAIDGDYAVIGADGDSHAGPFSGSAYAFVAGNEVVKLFASNAAAWDFFGFSVGVFGTRAIVGVPNGDPLGQSSGSAYVFELPSGQELFELFPADGDAGDLFGLTVAIGPAHAVGGAWKDEEDGEDAGSAYVFDAATGMELHKLTPGDAEPFKAFGSAVAVHGTLVLVGAPGDDFTTGAAYLFDAETGAELGKLEPGDSAVGDSFGRAVAMSDGLALVASDGAAYLFDLATQSETFKLEASDAGSAESFGASVAISNNLALVGASGYAAVGSDSGAAYAFDTASGVEIAQILPTDGAADDEFGHSVALDGFDAVFGTSFADDLGGSSGAAYLARVGDCNGNGTLDCQDIAAGTSEDANSDGVPDECAWRRSPTNDHWYRELPLLSWLEAEAMAVAWSGHLATVRSQSENDWLVAEFGQAGRVWIGYTDQDQEGSFAWVDGEAPGWENWATGEPDDFLGADWALLDLATGAWSDEPWLPEQLGVVEVESDDCNANLIPDSFEIAEDPARDWNGDGVLDSCAAANYCMATPNSSGRASVISALGSPVIDANDFTLEGSQLPTHEFGYFLMSKKRDFVPFFGGSSGNLCLGAPIVRLSRPPQGQVLNSGAEGVMTFQPNLDDLPQNVVLQPGDRWNFQLWFRDFDQNPTSNTTDGIEVMFR